MEKLKKALACYEKQTKSFRNLIVVNNHSNDGTFEYLEKWKSENAIFAKHVINTEDNLGGSGGFYSGQKKLFHKYHFLFYNFHFLKYYLLYF